MDHISNGVSESSSNGFLNGSSTHVADMEDCDAEMGKMNNDGCHLHTSFLTFNLLLKVLIKIIKKQVIDQWYLKIIMQTFQVPLVILIRAFHTEVESSQSKRQLCGGSQAAIERMIHFGRELQSMSEHLRRERGKNSANKKMLKVLAPSISSQETS